MIVGRFITCTSFAVFRVWELAGLTIGSSLNPCLVTTTLVIALSLRILLTNHSLSLSRENAARNGIFSRPIPFISG